MLSDVPCAEGELAKLCDYLIASGVVGLVEPESKRREDHIGALLVDCVLQAGLNYRYVVEPRVKRVKSLFPYATRLSIFDDVIDDLGAEVVLQWQHPEKPRRLERIVRVLLSQGIETTVELGCLLQDEGARRILGAVKGVGPKTLNYMQILCGLSTCAVDRHVLTFMDSAGIKPRNYEHAHALLSGCAEALSISADLLDSAVWRHQSTARGVQYA